VYVAPGGVYIGSAQVFVTPGPKYVEPYAAPYAAPTYDPGYAPGYLRRPAYYGGPAYGAPPYGPPPYAVDYALRPPVPVPYNGYHGHNGYNGYNGYGYNGYNGRCYADSAYGRYCN